MKYKGFYDGEIKRKKHQMDTRKCINIDGTSKKVYPTALDAERMIKALLVIKNRAVSHYYCGLHKGFHVGHNSQDWERQRKIDKALAEKVLTNVKSNDIIDS